MRYRLSCLFLFVFIIAGLRAQDWQYVDPRIGSEGLGRVFIGPSMPFGMVKPGPDCTCKPNSGWLPMPNIVTGFSQTHVSGTGGGPKYGNILIQPFLGDLNSISHEQKRKSESMSLGYYSSVFENGIRTEITTAERTSFYRITYPNISSHNLLVDCGFFLGENIIPDAREAQQFVGSEIEIVSDREIRGYTRIRGGWNNGSAYTVYFCLLSDVPFVREKTWRGGEISNQKVQSDDGKKTGALVSFSSQQVNIKIGISYLSSLKAKDNIPNHNFDVQLSQLRDTWETLFSRISIKGTDQQKRMFYTALYHTMLMPVDRSSENPLWLDTPYYDDYYALWDIYRTSLPLITILDPIRERDIVNSLLNIYKRDGYMPDARSGNSNGRTQGGSNAEVVIADAYVKDVKGIDYDLALQAMLKDADIPPGGNEENEGRGGLIEYNTLGYIPYGIDRAGNRTIEYAYDDYCIAQVAKGLHRDDIYDRFMHQSDNWKNLWRGDYCWDGMRGFIMPKDAHGKWLDSVPWGKSKVYHPRIKYTPVTKVAPWYLPWWSTFFYEATSEEYSLSIPHDVPALIKACGGVSDFRKRLDSFFDKKYYNVANEPSFLTPCLYHWLGRPDLSSDRVRQIIDQNYSDMPDGLPGNDDSGAMSSWLAFHMMGIYPNAGQSYYLLHAPLLSEYTIHLSNGNILHGKVVGCGTHFKCVKLNGKLLPDARIEHSDLMRGGSLVFYMDKDSLSPYVPQVESTRTNQTQNKENKSFLIKPLMKYDISFILNRQYRTWPITFNWDKDTLTVVCKDAVYYISRNVVDNSKGFCWLIPKDGAVYNNVLGTFCFISHAAMKDLLDSSVFKYNGILWRLIGRGNNCMHVRADTDRTEMWISVIHRIPLVIEMRNNPLGIDWKINGVDCHE